MPPARRAAQSVPVTFVVDGDQVTVDAVAAQPQNPDDDDDDPDPDTSSDR